MKIVWMTDPHILAGHGTLVGHDPRQRLRAAFDYVSRHHSDADLCVLTGDITDEGDVESYILARDIISSCPVTTFTIPGNHDNRSVMRSQLSFPDNIDPEFIQYSIIKGGQRLIFLDTLQDGKSEGVLCEHRLEWLDSQLSIHKDIPTLVFCHHPPGKLYLPMMDQEQTDFGEKLLHRLCSAANVRHLFFGHVHRPVSGNFRGLSFTALQSTAIQVPLPYPEWNWESFAPAEEAPAVGIIHTSQDSVVVHFHAFCQATSYVTVA